MKVKIRLKKKLLAKIKSKPKSMYLGESLILADWADHDIEEKHLMSEQCKHWMEIDSVMPDEKKAKVQKSKAKKEKIAEEE